MGKDEPPRCPSHGAFVILAFAGIALLLGAAPVGVAAAGVVIIGGIASSVLRAVNFGDNEPRRVVSLPTVPLCQTETASGEKGTLISTRVFALCPTPLRAALTRELTPIAISPILIFVLEKLADYE